MLKIYGVPISVHTRKVIVAALAKGLAHEVVPVVPVIPDNPPPNWRELSPTGLIPALDDAGFRVSDSSAICAYLERKQPSPPLYPQAAQDYARALSLEQYAGTLFGNVVRPLFHEVFVHPKVRGIPTDQSKIDAVQNEAMPEAFGYLDRVAGGGFLAGSAMSMADVAVASNLVTYQYIGFDLDRARFPRLAALFDRVLAQPAMREALEREQPVAESMGLRRDFLAAALALL
ncbi:MAG TPA: glutathione S-transferase family protein [Burkholderiales bacterium]|nr:glutathione S-transferase family protein [Burkholderiales bacterium]